MTAKGSPTVRTPTIGRITVDGVSAPCWHAGPADADEAIVCVHGLPGSGEDFVRMLPGFGTIGRAVAFDLPGFGRADKPPGYDYSSGGFADFIAGALAQLGIRRAHLVTHDFGGGWALEWAARDTDALASAVLMNTGLFGLRMHWLPRLWRTPVLGEIAQSVANVPITRMLLWHGNPRGIPKDFVDGIYANYDRGTKKAVLRMYRRIEPPAPMLDRLADVLAPLDRPAFVLWGVHDPYIPLKCAQRARLLFPSAEFTWFEDSGHWPFIDNPDRAQRETEAFLRRQLAAPEPAPASPGPPATA